MGKVRFDSTVIPVKGAPREVLNEELEIDNNVLTYCAATVGNPHCVVLTNHPTSDQARHYGPMVEVAPRFPNCTNVQFMKVIDRIQNKFSHYCKLILIAAPAANE
jgi:diaminopimelate epimerase